MPLSTGQGFRFAVEIGLQLQDLGCFTDTCLNFRFSKFAQLETEGHVFAHTHVWIQGIILEDHRNVTILRGDAVHHLAVNGDGPFGDIFEACNHSQYR
ncbi:hypothetical protein BMS3Bbin04_01761 [bacterium BMS3Bbin04]|nr:hypothetical protein BMS3Bbin04_01761 [bacterium BMS3Bbin04]